MKGVVWGAVFFLITAFVSAQDACRYDTLELDMFEENCLECGKLWSADWKCCDDSSDNFCTPSGESCVSGESYFDHCFDNTINCGESGLDCGAGCKDCCSASVEDGVCSSNCGVDDDIDCCYDFYSFNEAQGYDKTGWSDDYRCCEAGDFWVSESGASCVYGEYYVDHCTDRIQNCVGNNCFEDGIDCGGACASCISKVSDGICPSIYIYYPDNFFIENDPDCCTTLAVGGQWQDGRCCWSGGSDWCMNGAGSCNNGVYFADHCSDGIRNDFCGTIQFGGYALNTNELDVDCGGADCGSCVGSFNIGGACEATYDCGDGLYCSDTITYIGMMTPVRQDGVCCPYTFKWDGDCCSNSGVCYS